MLLLEMSSSFLCVPHPPSSPPPCPENSPFLSPSPPAWCQALLGLRRTVASATRAEVPTWGGMNSWHTRAPTSSSDQGACLCQATPREEGVPVTWRTTQHL